MRNQRTQILGFFDQGEISLFFLLQYKFNKISLEMQAFFLGISALVYLIIFLAC